MDVKCNRCNWQGSREQLVPSISLPYRALPTPSCPACLSDQFLEYKEMMMSEVTDKVKSRMGYLMLEEISMPIGMPEKIVEKLLSIPEIVIVGEIATEKFWQAWIEETSDFLGEGKGDAIPLKLRKVLPKLIAGQIGAKIRLAKEG